MPDCLIGLGSNVGDRAENIKAAVVALDRHDQLTVEANSRYFETEPIGGPRDQPGFLNSAARLTTSLTPLALLAVLQAIEQRVGRRKDVHWGPRLLDLDLLLYGERQIVESAGATASDTPRLIVPHPRMSFRRFVLEPASEVAGSMCHPIIGRTVFELLDHLNTTSHYVALAGPPGVDCNSVASEVSRRTGCHLVPATKYDATNASESSGSQSGRLSFERQIVMLDGCTSLLRPDNFPDGPVISDFWFDALRVNAQRSLDSSRFAEFELLWTECRQQVGAPRLIVIMNMPTGGDVDHALIEQAFGQGPQLQLGNTNFEQQCDEVEAALQASK